MRPDLVADAGVARPHPEGALEVRDRLLEVLVFLQQHAEYQLGVEVERVAGELGLELGLGPIAVAGLEQGAARRASGRRAVPD